MMSKTLSHDAIDQREALAVLVDRHTNGKGNGAHATAIDSLLFELGMENWTVGVRRTEL